MAATKNQRVKGDATKPFDPVAARCPECGVPIHMYLPPDRAIAGPVGYPSLLIHYEQAHTGYANGAPQGWPTPPPAPQVDEIIIDEESGATRKSGKKIAELWETTPPAPEDWQPIDQRLAERNLPQSPNVWPPVRVPERP